MTRRVTFYTILVIIASLLLAVGGAWDSVLTNDEVCHVGAGYSYVVRQDMRMNPEHPPLPKDLAAIPLLFLRLKQDAFSGDYWKRTKQWDFAQQLIYRSNNDADSISRYARFPNLIFFVLSGLLLFQWSIRLYGNWGAVLSLSLFCFSPLVLAHSPLVTSDLPATFGVLLASRFFLVYMKERTKVRLVLAGFSFGVALSLKFSLIILIPYLIILAVSFESLRSASLFSAALRGIRLCVLPFLIGIFFFIWPLYFLNVRQFPEEQYSKQAGKLNRRYNSELPTALFVQASSHAITRPFAEYAYGFFLVIRNVARGFPTYFLGEISYGSVFYFPVVYFIKEPIPWWGLFLTGAVIGIGEIKKRRLDFSRMKTWIQTHFEEFAFLLWLILYWSISLWARLNLGARHLLPTYPFIMILVSGILAKKLYELKQRDIRRYQRFRIFIVLMISWYVFEAIWAYPHYISYFNQTAGGPAGGYKYVVDSNVDWGQDLKRLSLWVNQNGIKKVHLDYFGWADPVYYLKDAFTKMEKGQYKSAKDFLMAHPNGGYIALSVHHYMTLRYDPDSSYQWLDSYRPIKIIGNSIFVWHLTPQTASVLP